MLSLDFGTIDARDHDLEPAGEFPVDREVAEASVDEFDALLIPGGTVNADKLRRTNRRWRSCATSSRRANLWVSSATVLGLSSRPKSSKAER